jgi:fructose-specific phosphotransferase system IIA component
MEEKIYEILPENQILLDMKSKTKEEALDEMVHLLESSPYILNKGGLLDNLAERERLESTGIGGGIALPHTRTDYVSQLVIGFCRSRQGIEFDSLDGNPVKIFFVIAAPKTSSTRAFKILAKISRLLHTSAFRKALMEAQTKKEIQDIIKSRET